MDSSAMLAFLGDEPEADMVEALLVQADQEAEGEVYAHAVNLAEVFYNIMGRQTKYKPKSKFKGCFRWAFKSVPT